MILAATAPLSGFLVPALILVAWLPYSRRTSTLAREGRAVPAWRRFCFGAGLLTLAGALSAPVDELSDQLLAAHMVEHLLIGDAASLLLVLGLTGPLLAPALRQPTLSRLRLLTHPAVALGLWAADFYVWHLPALYQAALRHEPVHGLEHACFLTFGLAVWMAILGPLPKPSWFGNAARLGYIVAVRLVGTIMGNVMVFSGSVLYPYYRAPDALHHIAPLTDQIIAGAMMMVEESFLTIGLFCWLFLKVAAENDERQRLVDTASRLGVPLDERRAARAVAAGRGDELLERLRRQTAT